MNATKKLLLVLSAALLATAAIACSGDDDDAPTSTPQDGSTSVATEAPEVTPSPADDPASSPVPTQGAVTLPTPSGSLPGGFLDFVREGVGLAVEEGDLVFFRERAVTAHVTCEAEDVPGLPGGPSCISEGEQFDGMPNAFFESETRLIDVEDVIATLELLFTEAMPSASDAFGSGEAQLFALGVPNAAWEIQDDAVELRSAETFATAITAIVELPADAGGAGPARATLVLNWADMNGDFRLVSVVSSLTRGEAMLMQTIAAWPVWEAAQP